MGFDIHSARPVPEKVREAMREHPDKPLGATDENSAALIKGLARISSAMESASEAQRSLLEAAQKTQAPLAEGMKSAILAAMSEHGKLLASIKTSIEALKPKDRAPEEWEAVVTGYDGTGQRIRTVSIREVRKPS